jgi:tetratricopeptide (TPR) repeat protein
MKNNKLFVGFLCINCLFPAYAVSQTPVADSTATLCLAATENNGQYQQEMETWTNFSRRQSPDEYTQQIDEIEKNEGVFASTMTSELLGLGVHYQEQLNFAEAAEAFERALYIIRVNEGLYSTKQIPVIDLLIESNSAGKNWKEVADSYDMLRWLIKRNYTNDDPRQLQMLKQLRSWYMESYNKDTGRSLEYLFSNAESVYKQALSIMLSCTQGDKRQTLCFWHKSCCSDAVVENGICPVDRG